MALLKRCRSILDDAEQRITELSASDDDGAGDEAEA
jgi:exonuclease VII small subunit